MSSTRPIGQHDPVSWPTLDGHIVTVFPGARDQQGKIRWYWHLTAGNHKVVSGGEESYRRRRSAERAARRLHPETS